MRKQSISRRGMLVGAGGLAGLPAVPAAAAGRSERLQITGVDLFKVVVPMQPDIVSSPELGPDALTEFPGIPKFMVKIHTDSGLSGVGETSRGLDDAQVRRSADYLRGKNIFDLNLSRLELPGRGAYAGFEIALYDAVGKAIGWPVYKLLGGLARRKVLVNYWCGRKNPADMKRVAERAVKGRFQGIKVKGRPGDPVVKAVEAIAAVSPSLKVTVDFNAHHRTVEEFLPIGKGLDAVGNMLVIEDPIVKSDLPGYRELRRQLKTPLALHLGDPRAMIQAIRAEACTIFNTGPSPSLASFVSNCYLAGAAGMPVWHGSGHELGVLDAAMLHSAAASANCTLPSDILSYQRVDDLIVQPIEIRDSYAIVPDRPGLGVELDEEACRRYRA
ncbi:MAG: mandelate racemase/muconate lactonizing enzyme family protein [Candidatus Solibacter usitatus]|nr:mandelate racemase/muconate lactonizing enzyme family protein [Candidatus Solibacter usitatus]